MIPDRSARRLVALGVIFACAGAAACGAASGPERSSGSKSPPRSVEPCSLLTKQDAEAVLGAPVRESPAESMTTPTCQYLGQRAQSVTLQVHPGDGNAFDSYVARADLSFRTQSR